MKNINKLFACLGVTVACLAGISQSAHAAVAGYVQFVSGDVQITNATGQTRPAQKGDAVSEGDTLLSAPSSSAQIKMQDGGFVAVRPDTQLKFDQFVFAGKEDGSEKSFYSLFKGGFRAVTGLIGRINKQNYKITTPAATIGIRGTDHETFLITPDSPLAQVAPTGAYSKVNVGETYMATEKGMIFVQPNQMGFAGGMNQMPQLQPLNTNIFTVAAAPTVEAKVEKKEEKKEGGESKPDQQAANGEKGETSEKSDDTAAAPVRESAVVDATPPAAGTIPAATTPVMAAGATDVAIFVPIVAPVPVVLAVGGQTINLTNQTITTTGGIPVAITGGNPLYAAQNGYGFEVLGVDTAGIWFNPFNINLLATSYMLDASNNLLEVLGEAKFVGGVAKDTYKAADNSVYMGRWQGGTYTNQFTLTSFIMGNNSSQWVFAANPPAGYVQTLAGTTSYSLTAATHPTDKFGNVGTLTAATLSADFTTQLVNINLALAFNTADPVNISTQDKAFTVTTPSGILISGDNIWTSLATAVCTGANCDVGGYTADIWARFAANAADKVAIPYDIWGNTTDQVQGVALVTAATAPVVTAPAGTVAAYVPSGVTVALSSPNWWSGSGWDNSFTVAPADITYTGGLPSGFTNRWGCPGCGDSNTTTVLGAANPVNGLAISNTGIEFGRWTTSTAIQHTYVNQLGTQYGAPDSWMYGPRGYLDAVYTGFAGVPIGAMAATFSYQLDGASAPYDRDTGLNGTLTSATLTADFTAMTVSAALGLSMPGGETWAANVANQPVYGNSFSAYANAGGTANTLAVTRNGAACPTCGGNLQAGFTGQNYAGAILSYQLYDHAASGNVVGKAALTRNFAGNTNPAVTNGTPVAPTNYFVADYGGSLQWVDAITATGNLLTAYSSGTPGISGSSTTVTCTTCTTAATGDVANSGIYYGTWQAGGWTNTWGGNISPGQFHWITGPEAGPVYLPEVLTGTVTYALDGGTTPTNWAGTAGTLSTATLTVNFTKQVVGISLSALVAGNTWSASTTAGNEAPLDYNTAIGRTAFYASSYQGGGPGTLTVSVSNVDGTLPANGWVSGNLTGGGLTGAVLSYNLNGSTFQSWDQINGVAAFVAPASDIAAPYRMLGVALTDSFTAAVPLPGMAGLYNAASRVTSDVTGNLTQFDISSVGGGGAQSLTLAPGTSTLANFGSDPLTGISWGRWQSGVINVTDRATGVVTPITLQGSAHWIAGPIMTAPVTLPVSGTFAYTLAGNTLPTNNLGANGTLNSATLSANFTAQTVDVGVNATVGATTMGASATGVPIMQGAVFGAGSIGSNVGSSLNPLTVTCAGTCGAAGSHGGQIVGGFTGAGATGAGMMYSLGTGLGAAGATVISGVAAFHR